MSVQRWLARPKPRGASFMRLWVQNEAHTQWTKDAPELDKPADFARELETIGEEVAESQGVQVAMRVGWLDKREKELPQGYSWTVGFSSGQATLDGSANAQAQNAQRHLEAVLRLSVAREQAFSKQQAALIDGFKSLADTARLRAVESDQEARMLRAELRAHREKDGPDIDVEDDGPSVLEGVLEKLPAEARDAVGPLLIEVLVRAVGMTGAADSGGSAQTEHASSETTNGGDDAPQDSAS